MKKTLFISIAFFLIAAAKAEDGYRLWLRFDKIENAALREQYGNSITAIILPASSPTLTIAKNELLNDLESLLGKKMNVRTSLKDYCILAGTPSTSPFIHQMLLNDRSTLGNEGYMIRTRKIENKNVIVIAGNKDVAVLYGVFAFLRLLQTHQSIHSISIVSVPAIQHRILNHWDNLNRTVERGYAGASIWNWHDLPEYIDQRYIDYARANASIGINGTVLTNVNANSIILTKAYLQKVKALADLFRPYGIHVYLTAKFSAPVEIGNLKTADPLSPDVQSWWREKCNEIYSLIPDFGGFLIKANSEGQPGPQGYGRTHADGANMFADALVSHGGLVIWRAFVYDSARQNNASPDRVKQAYAEFKPLDGKFRNNVVIQVKNGPLDFQPREPFSPIFGAMPQTSVALEFQLTQEYLGQGTHLVFEAPLFKETLDADTYAKGKGTTIATILTDSIDRNHITAIAAVSNIGNDKNWTHHPFGQANWYAYGRLAWNTGLSSGEIAEEWLRQTFSNNARFISAATNMMLGSREAVVNYMTPLGLCHIMGTGHHYGPAPWVSNAGRADWNPVYYHKADSAGIGFDRTAGGSGALYQYAAEVQKQWSGINTCNENYLLWFHHVPWTFPMKSGRIFWDELCYKYNEGVTQVRNVKATWDTLKEFIDQERYEQVRMFLLIQEHEAVWWKNACILYFQTFSGLPIPADVEKPDRTLEYYKSLSFPYAPGIGGNL